MTTFVRSYIYKIQEVEEKNMNVC